jgi:hypothetical protein
LPQSLKWIWVPSLVVMALMMLLLWFCVGFLAAHATHGAGGRTVIVRAAPRGR